MDGFVKRPISALCFMPRHCGVHKYASLLDICTPYLERFTKPSSLRSLRIDFGGQGFQKPLYFPIREVPPLAFLEFSQAD